MSFETPCILDIEFGLGSFAVIAAVRTPTLPTTDSWLAPKSSLFTSFLPLGRTASDGGIRFVAMECDRYGISDRVAASFASAVLQDTGIVREGEASHVEDRNKIRRQRKML
ncbi:hypothetical protein AVEN_173610-1 [Araneus ventricosus]|uniref:Uncharacterized protein n=1 Tax=Araneus ventricosus TaxID=182803 RepID=A0A4Y2CSS0_ARAVE|nr:hypothetical protein AVEN_173610-1 [Araneus ventricosus]